MIPVAIGPLGTVPKGLLREQEELKIDERADAIQIAVLIWSARILNRVLETWGDLHSLKLHCETIS